MILHAASHLRFLNLCPVFAAYQKHNSCQASRLVLFVMNLDEWIHFEEKRPFHGHFLFCFPPQWDRQGVFDFWQGWYKLALTLKCLSIGTPKVINFPFVSNEKLNFLGVPVFTHIVMRL